MAQRPYIGPSEAHSAALAAGRPVLRVLPPAPKVKARGYDPARDHPFQREHDSSVATARVIHADDLRLGLADLRMLWRDELPTALHKSRDGLEPGDALASPRWTDGFRAFVNQVALRKDEDGRYVWPVRAAIARMADDRSSARVRQAAALLYLVIRCDFDHEAAWRQQLGIFREDEFVKGTAGVQAMHALAVVEQFLKQDREWRGRQNRPEPECDYPTPECPHGHRKLT